MYNISVSPCFKRALAVRDRLRFCVWVQSLKKIYQCNRTFYASVHIVSAVSLEKYMCTHALNIGNSGRSLSDPDVPAAPHIFDKLTERSGYFSLHPEWVILVNIFLVVVILEIFGDGRRVG